MNYFLSEAFSSSDRRLEMVILSRQSNIARLASSQTQRDRHSPAPIQMLQDCFSRFVQSTITDDSSRVLTIKPMEILSGGFASLCPPVGPLELSMIPAFLSFRVICSRYFTEIFCLFDTSLKGTGLSFPFIAISRTSRVPYLLLVVSRIGFLIQRKGTAP